MNNYSDYLNIEYLKRFLLGWSFCLTEKALAWILGQLTALDSCFYLFTARLCFYLNRAPYKGRRLGWWFTKFMLLSIKCSFNLWLLSHWLMEGTASVAMYVVQRDSVTYELLRRERLRKLLGKDARE